MPFGSAFIFLFPFEIHTAESLRQPHEVRVSGRRVVIYPPFRNADGLRLRRPLENSSLPYKAGTVPPAIRLPTIGIAANPNWPTPFLLADALRIDVEGLGDDHDDVANAIGARFLRLLRLVTRQWWILRGASESISALQNAFPVDAWGQPIGGILRQTQEIIPWLRSEVLVDAQVLAITCAYLAAEVDVPLSCATLLDAAFSMAHGDKDQAVLLAAIACEALIAEEAVARVDAGQLAPGIARRELKVPDLRKRVDDGARIMFGRSFASDNPSAADGLGKLWVARHALAHGSRRQHDRNAVLNSQTEFADALWGAFAFFEWTPKLRPRQIPDPMALLQRPLTPAA